MTAMWRLCGCCVEVVWRLFGGCVEAVWSMCGGCVEVVWKLHPSERLLIYVQWPLLSPNTKGDQLELPFTRVIHMNTEPDGRICRIWMVFLLKRRVTRDLG